MLETPEELILPNGYTLAPQELTGYEKAKNRINNDYVGVLDTWVMKEPGEPNGAFEDMCKVIRRNLSVPLAKRKGRVYWYNSVTMYTDKTREAINNALRVKSEFGDNIETMTFHPELTAGDDPNHIKARGLRQKVPAIVLPGNRLDLAYNLIMAKLLKGVQVVATIDEFMLLSHTPEEIDEFTEAIIKAGGILQITSVLKTSANKTFSNLVKIYTKAQQNHPDYYDMLSFTFCAIHGKSNDISKVAMVTMRDYEAPNGLYYIIPINYIEEKHARESEEPVGGERYRTACLECLRKQSPTISTEVDPYILGTLKRMWRRQISRR